MYYYTFTFIFLVSICARDKIVAADSDTVVKTG